MVSEKRVENVDGRKSEENGWSYNCDHQDGVVFLMEEGCQLI